MLRFADMSRPALIAIYVAMDIVCVGLGMGVPIFCIAIGFAVGWVIAHRALASADRDGGARGE